ncbi:hypothetical protein HMPREF9946_00085, partial [Acetobacteraceae bacterium AT-5844]
PAAFYGSGRTSPQPAPGNPTGRYRGAQRGWLLTFRPRLSAKVSRHW